MTQAIRRLSSIDAFRALTMFLMIFVNDLESLKNIPLWLEHAKSWEDRMGLADTVFPAFLFIVGLSIPFAIRGREAKGYSGQRTLIHILTRSFALLVMGIYHVNLENYDKVGALLPKPLWQILITIGFFLVWLDFPASFSKKKKWYLQGSGIVLLVIMALVYQGTEEYGSGHLLSHVWMNPQWYGILGLIGWSYLLCALIYLGVKDRLSLLIGAFLLLIGLNMADRSGYLEILDPVKNYIWIVSSGALPAIVMAGVVCSVFYRKWAEAGKRGQAMLVMGVAAILLLGAGFALRSFWGISKIRATPSWVLICTAISMACFIGLIYLMDIKGRESMIKWLKPAGTSTLTCYLLPYIHYAILNWIGVRSTLPWVFRTGGIGIIKSLLYALVIVLITGALEKRKIRLSI